MFIEVLTSSKNPRLILQLYFWTTKSLKLVSRISWECAECQAKIYQDMMSSVDSLYPPFLLLLSYYLYISHIHSRSQTVKTHDCFLNLARKLATNLEILISVSDKNLLFWQPKSLLLQLLRLIILGVILCQWCHNFKKEDLAFWESWKIGLVLKI